MAGLEEENLKEKARQEVLESFKDVLVFEKFVCQTLTNFAYRYLSNPFSGEVKAEKVDHGLYCAQALENSMARALKCSDQKAKQGITELARQVRKKESPTVLAQILCQILEVNEKGRGKIKLAALLDWNFPQHKQNLQNLSIKEEVFSFEDFLDFRNRFAARLENVCTIF